MAKTQNPVLYIAVAVIAAVLGVAAALLLSGLRSGAPLQSGTQLPQPRALPDFTLVDQDARPFTAQQLQGRWTLLFPGFTYCPDVCPTTLAFLKQLNAGLDEAQRPRVVLLSVDPERDTPARLKAYVGHFDAGFIGVTAAEPQLSAIARALGVAYAKVPGASPEAYQMDHSASLILLNPQAQIVAYFSPPFDPGRLTADLRQVMESGS